MNKTVEVVKRFNQRLTLSRSTNDANRGLVLTIEDNEAQIYAPILLTPRDLQTLLNTIDSLYPNTTSSFVASKVRSNITRAWTE